MTSEQIKQALLEGKRVYWSNHGYVVSFDNRYPSGLGVKFIENGYYTALWTSELVDCFIGE